MSVDLHPDVVDAFCAEDQNQLWLHVQNLTSTLEAWPIGEDKSRAKVGPRSKEEIAKPLTLWCGCTWQGRCWSVIRVGAAWTRLGTSSRSIIASQAPSS